MTHYDLYAVGGQSNAVGRGDSAESPTPEPGTAIEYVADSGSIVDPLEDPVRGNDDAATTGSPWPTFCVDYHDRLSRPVAIVGAARGGTAQHADADNGNGNWDTGSLAEDLVGYVRDAVAAIEARGDTATFCGVLWHQGERDARAIDDGTIAPGDYETAFRGMLSRFRAALGDDTPVWILELGRRDSGDTDGYRAVRSVQREVVLDQPRTYMVSDRQKEFPDLGYMSDTLHYTQDGYSLMGEAGALNVAARVDPTAVFQLKRGDGASIADYTGAAGEPTVDTTEGRLVVHDGETPGGVPLAKEEES